MSNKEKKQHDQTKLKGRRKRERQGEAPRRGPGRTAHGKRG